MDFAEHIQAIDDLRKIHGIGQLPDRGRPLIEFAVWTLSGPSPTLSRQITRARLA